MKPSFTYHQELEGKMWMPFPQTMGGEWLMGPPLNFEQLAKRRRLEAEARDRLGLTERDADGKWTQPLPDKVVAEVNLESLVGTVVCEIRDVPVELEDGTMAILESTDANIRAILELGSVMLYIDRHVSKRLKTAQVLLEGAEGKSSAGSNGKSAAGRASSRRTAKRSSRPGRKATRSR